MLADSAFGRASTPNRTALPCRPPCALHRAQDALVQGLVEPRHRGHDGRPRLGHDWPPASRRPRRNRSAAPSEIGNIMPRRVLVGMGQRQEGQEHLVAEAELLTARWAPCAIGEDVAVRSSSPPWARRRCPRCRSGRRCPRVLSPDPVPDIARRALGPAPAPHARSALDMRGVACLGRLDRITLRRCPAPAPPPASPVSASCAVETMTQLARRNWRAHSDDPRRYGWCRPAR